MDWLRSTVRSAIFLLTLAGCAFSVEASSPDKSEGLPTRPAASPMTAVRSSLERLLDTRPLGPTATYERLGLQMGPAVRSFYSTNAYAARWTQDSGWNPQAKEALQLLGRAAEFGLVREAYAWQRLLAMPDSMQRPAARGQQLATCELHLTDALVRYLYHLRQGRLQPGTLEPAQPDSLRSLQTADLLHQALNNSDLTAAFLQQQPKHLAYRLLQTSWSRALRASAEDSLCLMQDTVAGFQRVAINLERMRWEAATDSEYAVVNIPAYRLQIIKKGKVLQTHRVVVGKPDLPTPILSSKIIVFVTAPEWRVPYSIAVREFLPELQKDPGYLYDNRYRLYDGRGRLINPWHVNWARVTPETFSYAIRQRAGATNALGNVVFYFPNQEKVFLHDTPARTAFTRTERAISHGCVRVEKPLKLAEYLLRREGKAKVIREMYDSVEARDKHRFDLTVGLPIYLRYYTCETDNGQLRFLPDIYQQDAALLSAFFGR
ncbi:L,D-transpeptidase catalytic domain [Hymenobacter gelipurpurascens]|uniref:L,D-transpeptidase catalytic domain n=1 Tax=Hymenobacter gelipurpurascens TaxID=89968 RepID=A0A212TB38_9BACT|nr:L,D-transpeptidase family protein [Hymenobacter gelipurpurascens]SNC63024.1 L,D-transpeptidase catalytic domain [Hymenobacter gelipurpurascens]